MEHITYIGHVDGDSFFASCEVARFPHLRNTAVVIGQERGIVTALTAEAKALGIQRGDPLYKIRNDYKNLLIEIEHTAASNLIRVVFERPILLFVVLFHKSKPNKIKR